ncbi:TetR/AcrR family transcriptional regulator [Paenibacillaceae bacterium]|nr:TetR/AcrR family transcriptional regulator [Paenibacillaceae bacterium]
MARPRAFPDDLMFQGIHQALCKRGFNQLTLEHIATEIAISPAALTKRFGSKKALLLFYIDMVISITEQAFADVCRLPVTRINALKTLFMRSMGQMSDPTALANFTSLFVACVSDPELLERSQRRLRVIDEQVKLLLNAAAAAQEIRGADIDKTARVLQSALGGALFIWLKDPDRPLAEWVDDCFDIVMGPLYVQAQ